GVHGDVAHVARQQQPAPVGGQVDGFTDIRAIEDHGVIPCLALDHVTAVAGIPNKDIVAVAHHSNVIPTPAVDQVVAVASKEHVVPSPPSDGAAASAAVQCELDNCRQTVAGGDDIVSAVRVDD